MEPPKRELESALFVMALVKTTKDSEDGRKPS